MRNTKLMTLLAAGLVLFACQKERAEEDILVPGNYLTFTATIDGTGTRTSVDGTKISWNPAEEINIFYGASEGSKFVSQNTEPSQSVTFSGTLTAFTGTTEAGEPNSFWAIYPYDESNSSSGSSVTAYLPENQVGVPDNVPDKALMMVAKAPGLALSFKQVCARIKVAVSTPGIRKIEIRGNNDETIAGSAVITMNSQGLPEWQDAGTGTGKVIELVPASGTTFEEAEYSIPIYPQTFSAGFTMTCYKAAEQGSYSTGAVTFGRNQVRTVNTNKVTEWTYSAPVPEAVDLGLPSGIKWASFNIGATTPEEYGDYFAWGETEPYYSSQNPLTWKEGKEAGYDWASYKWCNGSSSTLTKYCNDSSYGYNGYTDDKTILDPEDDAAHVNLGGNWRMPTDAEWTELKENCTWTWTTRNGVNGRLVTGSNGNTIFLPAASVWIGTSFRGEGANGSYWSSTLHTDNPISANAWSVYFDSNRVTRSSIGYIYGYSVRPVFADVLVTGITLNKTAITFTEAGETDQLTATVTPSDATISTVTWSSSDNTVATVQPDGTVTAVGDGTAIIIATANDGSGVTAECTVTMGNIVFADENVKSICVANWDTNGDGELSYSEAAAVANIGSVFKSKTNITSFEELRYFTGLTSLWPSAFSGCSRLTTVIIPNSVTTIEASAFDGCSSLTSINIPEGVTSIGGGAFSGCSRLARIDITDLEAWCNIDIMDNAFSGGYLYLNGTQLTEVSIPNSIEVIKPNAFQGIRGIVRIDIPDGVTSIGNAAFNNCYSLRSVDIPDSVTSIGDYAFSECSFLTSIIIPAGVTSIGYCTFENCSGLTSIVIPDGVTSIGNIAFLGCSSLASIDIPDSVTSIGNNAFTSCSSLTSIIIPDSVTSIGSHAFELCSGLTNIALPDGLTSIGDYTFKSCSGLTSVNIPDGVTSIGTSSFSGCSSLTSVNIPDGVTSIGETAFSLCSRLTTINIPDGVTTIGSGAFYGCSNLRSINIPEGVTSIGGITFKDCSRLTGITIPNSVSNIGAEAFRNCSGLTFIKVLSSSVPTGGTNMFMWVSCPIYVLDDLVPQFKEADIWKNYASQIVGMSTFTE